MIIRYDIIIEHLHHKKIKLCKILLSKNVHVCMCTCTCVYCEHTFHSIESGVPFQRKRSKSIDDTQRQIARAFVTEAGLPITEFPDPQSSRLASWLQTCLTRLGRGSKDYSLLVFHKNNWFRRRVKQLVKSVYPLAIILYTMYTCIHVRTCTVYTYNICTCICNNNYGTCTV